MKSHNHQLAGFSLIELLVSMSIFTVVVTMSVGTLLVLIDANAKAQNTQNVMTNITFALDSMTREIRTGSGYRCSASVSGVTDASPNGGANLSSGTTPADCSSGNRTLAFVEGGSGLTGSLTAGGSDDSVAFSFVSNYFGTGKGALLRQREGESTGGQRWFPITSENVTIEDLVFTVTGAEDSQAADGDTVQPTITIVLRGRSGDFTDTDSVFTIQTTVGQRLLDI